MPIKLQTYQAQVGAARMGGGYAPQQSGLPNVVDNGLGRVLEHGGKAFNEILGQRYEQQLATDLINAELEYGEEIRAFEDKYKQEHLRADARTSVEDYDKFHGELAQKYSDRFTGRAKALWMRTAGQARMSSLSRAVQYRDAEDKLYRSETTDGLKATYLQKVADQHGNDEAIHNLRVTFNTKMAAVNKGADLTGVMAEMDQATAVTRIKTALGNGDSEEAERLLGSYRGVLADNYDEMANAVNTSVTNKKAFEISETIRTGMDGKPLSEQLDRLNELAGDDVDLKRAAKYYVHQNFDVEKLRQKEMEDSLMETFIPQIEQAKDPQQMQVVVDRINATPMKAGVRKNLLDSAHRGLKHPLVSKDAQLAEVRQLIADEKITATDLERKYKYSLSAEDYDEQMTMLKAKGGARISRYMLDLDAGLNNSLAEISKGKQRKEATKQFTAQVKQYIKEYQAENDGSMPSDADLDKHRDWLLEKVIYNENDFWWDKSAHRFQVDAIEDEKFDIPSKARADIEQALRDRGKPVNEKTVLDVYRASLRRR